MQGRWPLPKERRAIGQFPDTARPIETGQMRPMEEIPKKEVSNSWTDSARLPEDAVWLQKRYSLYRYPLTNCPILSIIRCSLFHLSSLAPWSIGVSQPLFPVPWISHHIAWETMAIWSQDDPQGGKENRSFPSDQPTFGLSIWISIHLYLLIPFVFHHEKAENTHSNISRKSKDRISGSTSGSSLAQAIIIP